MLPPAIIIKVILPSVEPVTNIEPPPSEIIETAQPETPQEEPEEVVLNQHIALSESSQINEYTCSCISYMRELGHDFRVVPDPSYLEPDGPPSIGGLVLIDYPGWPHIGHIMDLRGGVLFYKEQILIKGKCHRRWNWIAYDDPKVRGYMLP